MLKDKLLEHILGCSQKNTTISLVQLRCPLRAFFHAKHIMIDNSWHSGLNIFHAEMIASVSFLMMVSSTA